MTATSPFGLDRPHVGRVSVVPGLSAASYVRSPLHAHSAIWPEKNCYADFWIELLHAKGMAPEALLPFVVGIDFDGDQWTFFKPSHDELYLLYGIKVQEMTAWRPWADHAMEHLSAGRWLSVEADAYHLPDTAGTDYRQKHSKTTIVFNELDWEQRRLGYFHNAGYYELSGEDFDATLKLNDPPNLSTGLPMPFFAELYSFPSEGRALSGAALLNESIGLMRHHLTRVPGTNPVIRFADRFARDLPVLQQRGLPHYHAWAFACTRQLGAAFELAASWIDWVQVESTRLPDSRSLTSTQPNYAEVAKQAFLQVATDAKGLILKGARVVANGRALEVQAQLQPTAEAWERGITALRSWLAARP